MRLAIVWTCLLTAGVHAAGFLGGGDVSMLTKVEQAGVVFKDDGQAEELIKLMQDNGCSCFRLRLFVNPNGRGGVVQDIPYTIALAKRIKAAGAVFMLDLHYSDTWADPAHQIKPAAWKDLPFEELVKTVESYTAGTIAEFKKQDALPELVQIGNEIQPGFLWPEGRLDDKDPNSWPQFTGLLKAGIRGVRQATRPEDKVKIIIHIAAGGEWDKTDRFFTNCQKYGVEYDIIGQSFYPWWHGTMDELKDNLARTAEKFKKDIMVVETAYPWQDVTNFEARAERLEAMTWEKSPAGQKAFLEELIRTVRETPDGRGIGVLWWYPESVPMKQAGGWNGGITALFDAEGNALPAMKSFAVPSAAQ
ncbi:MAG: glycosyl hydrolase 53 family protein [Anaerohalosphaeraceae bacterium]